jgi:hypothetical protein
LHDTPYIIASVQHDSLSFLSIRPRSVSILGATNGRLNPRVYLISYIYRYSCAYMTVSDADAGDLAISKHI